MEQKNEHLISLLLKLKKANYFYQLATEEQRGRILEACQPTLVELVELGYSKVFAETLLIGGKEFLESIFDQPNSLDLYESAKLIFT